MQLTETDNIFLNMNRARKAWVRLFTTCTEAGEILNEADKPVREVVMAQLDKMVLAKVTETLAARNKALYESGVQRVMRDTGKSLPDEHCLRDDEIEDMFIKAAEELFLLEELDFLDSMVLKAELVLNPTTETEK